MKFNPFNLTDRVAMVTGGNGGIGLSIAKGLAAAGASVAIASRNDEKTYSAVKLLRGFGAECIGIKMDVTSEQSVTDAVEKVNETLGSMNILVNNAAVIHPRMPLMELPMDDWEEAVNVNLLGAVRLTKMLLPNMVTRKWGKIVNISSIASTNVCAEPADYHAAKAGLNQLTKYLAFHAGAKGVRVNAVSPGLIIKEGGRERFEKDIEYKTRWKWCHPLGKVGDSTDVGNAIGFLASDMSKFITGQVLPIDGGLTLADQGFLVNEFSQKK